MQLASFLLVDDELPVGHRAVITAARTAAATHACMKCGHNAKSGQCWPQVVSDEEAEHAPSSARPVVAVVSASASFFSLQARLFSSRLEGAREDRALLDPSQGDSPAIEASAATVVAMTVVERNPVLDLVVANQTDSAVKAPESGASEAAETSEWVVVSSRKRGEYVATPSAVVKSAPTKPAQAPAAPLNSSFSVLSSLHGDPRPVCSSCSRSRAREM